MPYISLRTTKKFAANDELSVLAKEITDTMSGILGKGTDTIMVDIQTVDGLFMGGSQLDSGAVVEIMVFGKASDNAKAEANDFLCNVLQSKLGINKSKVYVIYFDQSEWGYKGSYIS